MRNNGEGSTKNCKRFLLFFLFDSGWSVSLPVISIWPIGLERAHHSLLRNAKCFGCSQRNGRSVETTAFPSTMFAPVR
jgi:hypothetical protein